jgi:hypothetical protein
MYQVVDQMACLRRVHELADSPPPLPDDEPRSRFGCKDFRQK